MVVPQEETFVRDLGFNPLDPDVLAQPLPTYNRLRSADRVSWDEGLEAWLVTGYAESRQVLGDSQAFISDWRKVGVPTPSPAISIQSLDPPEHTTLRQVLIRSFSATDPQRLEEDGKDLLRETLDSKVDGEPFDFVSEVSGPLALSTVCGLLGIEPPEHEPFARVSNTIVTGMDFALVPEAEEPAMVARATMSEWINEWLERQPEGGVIGYLSRSPEAADLPSELLHNTVRAVVQAGYQSWGRFLGIAVLNLLKQGAIERLRTGRPNLAVQELLRYESSVQGDSRAASQDIELGGKQVRAGDIVILIHGAADHDPDVFDRPDELMLDREDNPHMAFGHGIHKCPGAPLVSKLTTALLTELAERDPPLRLVGEPEWKPNVTLRGLERLPVAT